MSDDPEHVHEAGEEAGPPGLAGYRDREHQAHPEGREATTWGTSTKPSKKKRSGEAVSGSPS
jgi:hypothetical protein